MRSIKILFLVILPGLILAAEDIESGSIHHLDGSQLSILWVLPFMGILFSIAILPLFADRFWHNNFGKVTIFWAMSFIIPFAVLWGASVTFYELAQVSLLEYIPFIILLLSLFTISGGIRLTGTLIGTPILNTALILIGTVIASWMGTTGAAMLLIRPLIRANLERKNKVHIIVFFIFLVANIGGSLTPLGDPPLFLGFLKGVDFFWTTDMMLRPMLFMVLCLLSLFYLIDSYYYRKEGLNVLPPRSDHGNEKLGVDGAINFLFLAGVIGAVLLSGIWKSTIIIDVYHVPVHLQNLIRDLLLLGLTMTSWLVTARSIREHNQFTWFPIQEVAKLFAGIFVTIIPVIAILKAGTDGALAMIVRSVSNDGEPINQMYFWATGVLSSFLDNAPTYLVFFNTAGGDAVQLMGDMKNTLLAISVGAVFMGANTYIGNAPNFMVKSIAQERGIDMPSFFGYLIKYSIPILLPLYIIVSWIFF
ncbi:MAG: sodium:proton antiporter [Candidatus Neomarinimicrobiota bacterium]